MLPLGAERPNVIVILADDVGYGDLSCHGNELIQTPRLDALRAESARFDRFFVNPTCSATRAALMTGRWPFEAGVNHTIGGRSLLKEGLPTVAESFQLGGYRTGIFGKWHLGDALPSRPSDRGFDEVFVHLGGGIGQAPDYWGNSYFNPTVLHNGKWEKQSGFCTDVFVSQAMGWASQDTAPYFLYLPLNVAQKPWTADDAWTDVLKKRGVDEALLPFYTLVEQMDAQIGRLLDAVEGTNTIVVFLSDNGTASETGYNAEMKGRKGSANEGGVRVPSFIRWKGKIQPGLVTEKIAGDIDLFPTLCGLAGLALPESAGLAGADWSGWLQGKSPEIEGRTFFTNAGSWSDRTDPQLAQMRNFSVRNDQFRLVPPEMFDMTIDPGQANDVMDEELMVAAPMLRAYRKWWAVQRTQIYKPVRIIVGDERDPQVTLCAHDWFPSSLAPKSIGASAVWDQSMIKAYYKQLWELRAGRMKKDTLPEIRGVWKIHVAENGQYKITLRKLPKEALKSADKKLANIQEGRANLIVGRSTGVAKLNGMVSEIEILLDLERGPQDLEAWFEGLFPGDKQKGLGCFYVDIERVGGRSFEK